MKLLWVDDESRSAVWRVGAYELMVNCGADRTFPVGGAELTLATCALETPSGPGGRLSLPRWSAAVLRRPTG
jgi:hypothetical protein